jgi:6-phosphogluconolactonase
MKMKNNIVIVKEEEFNVFSSNFIKEKLEALSNKRVINVALSGGSTPLPILKILRKAKLNWDDFNFFLVDERVVELNSNECNYKNINEIFYKFISSKSFSIVKEKLKLDEMVLDYEKKIKEHLPLSEMNQPRFDIIILGMGEDGHTASLFPNTSALNEIKHSVVKNYVPQINSNRVTLTYPVLFNADQLIVLVKGEKKIKIVEEIMGENDSNYPISKLKNSKIKWIIGK